MKIHCGRSSLSRRDEERSDGVCSPRRLVKTPAAPRAASFAAICASAVVLAVSGCGSSDSGPRSSTTTSTGAKSTRTTGNSDGTGVTNASTTDGTIVQPANTPVEFAAVKLAGVEALRDAEGLWPIETLLSWWAAVFGPVDGVSPLADDVVADADNTDLVRAMTQVLDKLPQSVQAQVVEVAFPKHANSAGGGVPRDGATGAGASGTSGSADSDTETSDTADSDMADTTTAPVQSKVQGFRAPRQGDLTQAAGEALVDSLRPVIERWLGEPLGIGIEVHVSNRLDVFSRPLTGAMAVVEYFAGRIVGRCVIHVRQSGGPVERIDQWRKSAVIHELYHCYQYRLVNDQARTAATPPWVGEGTAAYVGEKLSGGSMYSTVWMRTWLESAAGELSNRSYDAIGLAWLLDDAGVPMKQRFDQLLLSNGNTAERLTLALGSDRTVADQIRNRWGAHVANQTWSAIWAPPANAHAPSAARAPGAVFSYLAGGRPQLLRSRGTKAGTFTGTTSGDLLSITVASQTYGAVRLPGGTDFTFTPGTHHFCLTVSACQPCPSTGDFPMSAPGGPSALTPSAQGALTIGVMTQTEGSVSIQGANWADECGESIAPPVSEPPVDEPTKCTERVPKSEFRRLTGETYLSAYESSRDQCIFENANFEVIADLDATPLTTNQAKAITDLRSIFVDGPDGGYSPVSRGWTFAAISPDGTHFIGVHSGKQFFSTKRSSRITTAELQALTKFYLAQF